jgi:hypothetical protein
MKFNQLCRQLFLNEQDAIEKKEIAQPEDFNDVEPIPSAEQPQAPQGSSSAAASSTLQDHVTKLNEFVDFLNGTKAESLQTFLNKLDVHATPFEGISDNAQIKSAILSTVKSANDIVAIFNQYINTAKN